MAEHSQLTGASLHEPKGADSAVANRVYITDGIGSGEWAQVTNDVLDSTAKAFQGQLLHIQDVRAAGTSYGTIASGDWRTRTLNTVVTNEISSASLSANRITLPSGTYYVKAQASAGDCGAHMLRLYNVTDAAAELYGTTAYSETGQNVTIMTPSFLNGRFTIASTKVFELQHRVRSTANGGFGINLSGVSERYAEVLIWKIA